MNSFHTHTSDSGQQSCMQQPDMFLRHRCKQVQQRNRHYSNIAIEHCRHNLLSAKVLEGSATSVGVVRAPYAAAVMMHHT